MSPIDNLIEQTEKELEKRPPLRTFDECMDFFDKLSVEENEKHAREQYQSGWKNELRSILKPYEDRLEKVSNQATLELILALAFQFAFRSGKDAVTYHWLFRQVKKSNVKTGQSRDTSL